MLTITDTLSPAAVATVRTLIREYQAQLGVDLSYQDFESEMAGLPGDYAPPRGRLLLATNDGEPVGCVGMRDAGDGRAEMKRLYVCDAARGLGIGRALVAELVRIASAEGYDAIVLDTLPVMAPAQRLYEELGFRDIPAYRPSPMPGTRYLGLDLRRHRNG